MSTTEVPEYSPFFAVMGASAAMVFSALGAAYGTAKSGTGIAAMSVMRPELIMKSIIPVVMAGIIAIYGLVVAVLIANSLTEKITLFKSFLQLGAGLSVGTEYIAFIVHSTSLQCTAHDDDITLIRSFQQTYN
ncbi:V-type proton ATPase 16 kDa proteolipid subunit c-like [Scyliorhinus torazame]|uniref:V-type proton ATPase 16 kDa proteolipid subunit c-like n=1 Tax=Scyliorhinus torazame TaxID=75743 RepID=UPI003B5B9714